MTGGPAAAADFVQRHSHELKPEIRWELHRAAERGFTPELAKAEQRLSELQAGSKGKGAADSQANASRQLADLERQHARSRLLRARTSSH